MGVNIHGPMWTPQSVKSVPDLIAMSASAENTTKAQVSCLFLLSETHFTDTHIDRVRGADEGERV